MENRRRQRKRRRTRSNHSTHPRPRIRLKQHRLRIRRHTKQQRRTLPARHKPTIRFQRQRMGDNMLYEPIHRPRRKMQRPPKGRRPKCRRRIIPRLRRPLRRPSPRRHRRPNLLHQPRLYRPRMALQPRTLPNPATMPRPNRIQPGPPKMPLQRMGHSKTLRNRLRMPRRNNIQPRNHRKHHRTGLIDLKTSPNLRSSPSAAHPVVPKHRLANLTPPKKIPPNSKKTTKLRYNPP